MSDPTAPGRRLAFDRVPELYDEVRPSYPAELFSLLFDALPAVPRILEVGPGTGKATGELLARGADVVGVELGPQLSSLLRAKFPNTPQLDVSNASFEEAPVTLDHFDAVFAATAYHWIKPPHRLDRPFEVLTRTGTLAILDLIQVESPSDRGYFDRVQPIYDSFGEGRPEWNAPTYTTAEPQIVRELANSSQFVDTTVHRVPWDQTYTTEQYRSLLHTYSATQMMPPQQRDSLVDQLVAVIDHEFSGRITRPLVATLTLASKRAPR